MEVTFSEDQVNVGQNFCLRPMVMSWILRGRDSALQHLLSKNYLESADLDPERLSGSRSALSRKLATAHRQFYSGTHGPC